MIASPDNTGWRGGHGRAYLEPPGVRPPGVVERATSERRLVVAW
ncbi:MAG: hypothetical protein M0029_01330 [Actinomycetota bacterium]|nr:hypothetical protein [Actinomycetota bacterium]